MSNSKNVESALWKIPEQSMYFERLCQELDIYKQDDPSFNEEALIDLIKEKTDLPQLINDLIYFMGDSVSMQSSLEEMIKSLTERKNRFARREERIRDTLKLVFERFQLKKLECPLGTVSYVNKPASKVTYDESMLLMNHPEYFVRGELKLNKTKVREDLKNGIVLEGAKLEDQQTIMVRK